MKRSGWRLAVSAILFAGWIGYLAFLAATTTEPTVLSRPQFLAADLYVVAELGPTRYWPAEPLFVAAPAGGPMTAALRQVTPAPLDGPGEIAAVRQVVWAADAADRGERVRPATLPLRA